MIIHSKPIVMGYLLQRAGYKKLSNGSLVRQEGDGRYHAYVTDTMRAEIHYDLYVDRTRTTHFAPRVPIKMKGEARRLRMILGSIRKEIESK